MEYDDKYNDQYNDQYNDIKSDISSPSSPSMYSGIIWLLICISMVSIYYFIVNYICINIKKMYHNMVINILIKEINKDEIVDKINNTCSICLGEYIDDRKMSRLKCGHIYHKECIMKWINNNNNECPLCRTEVI